MSNAISDLLDVWSIPFAALALCLIASPSTPIALGGGSIVVCLLVCEWLVTRGE